MMATIAKRPLASSDASLRSLTTGSLDVMSFHPKSPAAPGVPGAWLLDVSQNAIQNKICPHPSTGTLEIAAKPFGTSANLRPAEGERVSRKFPGDFWCHVAHSSKHRNATMLDFSLTTALVGINITISCESNWIPESEGRLGTHLVLEGTQRRCGVVGPVTPGASSQAILRQSFTTKGHEL